MCTWRAPHVQCAERQMLAQHTSGDHVAFERHHTRFGARLGRRGPCKRKLRRRLHHSLTASLRRAPHEGAASVLGKKVRLASQLGFMIREHELAVGLRRRLVVNHAHARGASRSLLNYDASQARGVLISTVHATTSPTSIKSKAALTASLSGSVAEHVHARPCSRSAPTPPRAATRYGCCTVLVCASS